MLSRSFVSASYCEHVINLVNLVSKNVISVVNVHGCVSVSVSMSNLVVTIYRYVIASVTRNKDANCKNTSGFWVFSLGSHSKKRIALIINVMCL